MGTYTTNYQLYTPTVGETGWGTLVNGNFSTIDTIMKGLDTRIGAHYTVTQGDEVISLNYKSYGEVPFHFDLINDTNSTYSGTVTVTHSANNGGGRGLSLYAYNPKTGYITSTYPTTDRSGTISATLTFENASIVSANGTCSGGSSSYNSTLSFNNIILTPSE